MSKQPLYPHTPKSRVVLFPHVSGHVPQAGLAVVSLPAEEEKPAWQMTRLEIAAQTKADMIRNLEEDIRAGVADPTAPQALADIREMLVSLFDDENLKIWHKAVVRDALREGKEVPPEVLQEYPVLAQKRLIKEAK